MDKVQLKARNKMAKRISSKLLKNFDLESVGEYNSKTMMLFQNDIIEAIDEMQMMAVIGMAGSGKTTLFSRVKDQLQDDVQFVYVRNFNKEGITTGNIIEAVFDDLKTGERQPRSLEAKSRQFIRVVGEKAVLRKEKICVVIEEAHRLNVDLFRTLKEMREAEYTGVAPLFSVILIGHPELGKKLRKRNETGWRTRSLLLTEESGWFDYGERLDYLQDKYGKAIETLARKRIAVMCKTPLQMDKMVETKMYEGSKAGKRVLDSDVIEPSLKEYWEMVRAENPIALSYRRVAAEMNKLSKKLTPHNTIGPILGEGDSHPKAKLLKRGIAKISEANKKDRLDNRKVG